MADALYDPQDGYYARPAGQVGKAGDFITSVSIGPLFGRLLARHIASWHRQAGSPDRWRVLETGANDSSLASDIITALERLGADAGLEYVIIEPLPRLAQDQRKRLPFVAIHGSATALADDPLPTFVLGNEVIDALPFHVIESDGHQWLELGVALDADSHFHWHPFGPAAAELVGKLPLMPAGYRTEVRGRSVRDFLAPLAGTITKGDSGTRGDSGTATGSRMLWIDYGFPRDDYYHESRTTGTLRTFSRHRAGEDPLDAPGEIDITAHVDFTALAEDLDAVGGKVIRFEPQGRYLTHIARPWLLEMEGRTDDDAKKDLRAFQTLTHPGHLGSRFHVMEAEF
jgi:SAM-dependent MidA family methyltransferase